jgi:hypothetical protein
MGVEKCYVCLFVFKRKEKPCLQLDVSSCSSQHFLKKEINKSSSSSSSSS